MGKRHGALPRRDNKAREVPFTSRTMISGIHNAIPHFGDLLEGLRAHTVSYLLWLYRRAALYGVVYRARFSPPWKPPAFRDTTLLWSAQLSCVQMSGFRVRDGLLAHTVRKPIRGWAPSLLPLRCLPYVPTSVTAPFARPFPFPWSDPRRHINYPANGRSFGIIRNLIRGYTRPAARAHACMHLYVQVDSQISISNVMRTNSSYYKCSSIKLLLNRFFFFHLNLRK